MNRSTTVIIALLIVIIVLLTWLLIVNKAEAPTLQTSAATTTGSRVPTAPAAPSAGALHERIQVSYPKANASVPKQFTVTGKAPGNWFNEAQAPLLVQAEDGSKIGQAQMQAQGDWMTTDLVNFKANVTIDMAYSGPATLVLLKDNESGLPQNDDSFEVPIVVQ
jgi:hypothetical protein